MALDLFIDSGHLRFGKRRERQGWLPGRCKDGRGRWAVWGWHDRRLWNDFVTQSVRAIIMPTAAKCTIGLPPEQAAFL
jgi:hypothetical protein